MEGGTTQCYILPPPVKGLNTKDAEAFMDPLYVTDVANWFSDGGTVDVRNGYVRHAKNVGSGAVAGIAELGLADGTKKMIAGGSNGRIYDVSSGGSSPTDLSSAGTLLVDSTFASVNFRNRIFVKDYNTGHDVYYWDGSAGALTAPAFTGPGGDDKALCNPQAYKSRLYFVAYVGTSVWYGGVDAISGALTEFNVESLLLKGGVVYFAGSATRQGAIDQEYFVVISNQGEVLVYQGDYPDSATWGLIGRYFMPPPIGYRSFFYWGSNLVIITVQGVILLSEVLRGSSTLTFLTDNINKAFTDFFGSVPAEASYTNGVYYAKGNKLIINVGSSSGTLQQFVMNTTTGSWWVFTGITAYYWAVFDGDLYFGGSNSKVFQADTGTFDEDPTVDDAVLTRTTTLRQAFNYFDDRVNFKTVTQMRPIIRMTGGLTIRAGVNADFSSETIGSTAEVTNSTDTSSVVYRQVIQAKGHGKAIAPRIDKVTNNATVKLYATEVYYETGGPYA